jgi:predicted nucleic acid-binding protein
MTFLLDTNVFIEAKNRYYAFDICPGFWEWMDSVCEADVASIVSVRDELTVGKDELADWAKERKDAAWFLGVDDADTQGNFSEIVQYVATAHYNEPAVAKFLGSADALLIAKARAIGATVVTHELPNPESKKRVLIPDVCHVFDVSYMNTFEALRQFSAKFVWAG